MPLVIIELFQDPRFGLAAAVAEGYSIKIIFNDRFRFRGCLLARGRRSRTRLLDCGRSRRRGRGLLGVRLLLFLGRRLRQISFQDRLKGNDDQKSERENQQETPLHSGFVLRIGEFWHLSWAATRKGDRIVAAPGK